MSDEGYDSFDSPPQKQPAKATNLQQMNKPNQNGAKNLQSLAKNVPAGNKIPNAVNKMNDLVNQKPVKKGDPTQSGEPTKLGKDMMNQAVKENQEGPPHIMSWQEIIAANDTNKHIIFKFMKKGFTSLSAEELACTMVQADFSLDFKKNTNEDWIANYQFKVIERLQKCNFNLKWSTKASKSTSGQGDFGTFFDLCKRGDIDQVLKFFRSSPLKTEDILEATDKMQGKTGLHYAVEAGEIQMIEYLLNKGAKIDMRDKLLRTPLHLACLGGHSVIAKLLLEFNADPFERDVSGRTSMHFAVCTGSVVASIELMATLVGKDTDLCHMKDHTGRTPLHYAIFNEQPDSIKVLQALLRYNVNIDAMDVDRRTPLHFTAEAGKAKVCQLLIQNGASVGIKDSRGKTPMDLAATDYIREIMIVLNPHQKFTPQQQDIDKLAIEGEKATIRKVMGLPNTDFYEPYEHAQPKTKSKKKAINSKPQKEDIQPNGVMYVKYEPGKPGDPTPEMLCMQCRPLGVAAEWEAQKQTISALPYNIRNYQSKLVENLRRIQQFGVDSFQHVKKPYLFTGSWMEYVRNLDDLMLQINGVKSNEAVLKVFNILFPYDKPLPRGQGDELSLANFYNDQKAEDDLKDCHPDKLRENMEKAMGNMVTEALEANKVENVNDLLTLQQQMTALQTANHALLVTCEQKDDKILELTELVAELKKNQGAKILDKDLLALQQENFKLKQDLEKFKRVKFEEEVDMTDNIKAKHAAELMSAAQDAEKLKKDAQGQKIEVMRLKQQLDLAQKDLDHERERNIQLRMKAGKAFMEALDNPDLQSGKIKTNDYVLEDDNALMRLLQKVDALNGPDLEARIYDAGNPTTKAVSMAQWNRMLGVLGTRESDYLPMQRIAGYTSMQGNSKNIKASLIMQRIRERPAMRQRIEEQTLTRIADYIKRRQGMTVEKLFAQLDTDMDDFIDIDELQKIFAALKMPVNNQVTRIILALFDTNADQKIDCKEFKEQLKKYLQWEKAESKDLKSAVIDEKTAQEVVDIVNEAKREKAVFELDTFDHDDTNVLKMREQEAKELIMAGSMPKDMLDGEIKLNFTACKNLTKVPNKNFLQVILKRFAYNQTGDKVKEGQSLTKICKKFNEAAGEINLVIPIKEFLGKDKNMQADTFTIEFYKRADMADRMDINSATQIGEINQPWKLAVHLEDPRNPWVSTDSTLKRGTNTKVANVTGQVKVRVAYIKKGDENSSFNADGSLKVTKPVHTEFVKEMEEKKIDRRTKVQGEMGNLKCKMQFIYPNDKLNMRDGRKYVGQFSFGTSKTYSVLTMPAMDKKDHFMIRQVPTIPVKNTEVDVDMRVYLCENPADKGPKAGDPMPTSSIVAMADYPVEKIKEVYKTKTTGPEHEAKVPLMSPDGKTQLGEVLLHFAMEQGSIKPVDAQPQPAAVLPTQMQKPAQQAPVQSSGFKLDDDVAEDDFGNFDEDEPETNFDFQDDDEGDSMQQTKQQKPVAQAKPQSNLASKPTGPIKSQALDINFDDQELDESGDFQ